jgi:hypothetical protein
MESQHFSLEGWQSVESAMNGFDIARGLKLNAGEVVRFVERFGKLFISNFTLDKPDSFVVSNSVDPGPKRLRRM